jgi:hypothetical protein
MISSLRSQHNRYVGRRATTMTDKALPPAISHTHDLQLCTTVSAQSDQTTACPSAHRAPSYVALYSSGTWRTRRDAQLATPTARNPVRLYPHWPGAFSVSLDNPTCTPSHTRPPSLIPMCLLTALHGYSLACSEKTAGNAASTRLPQAAKRAAGGGGPTGWCGQALPQDEAPALTRPKSMLGADGHSPE